jgi:ABC-type antimicrobial peptide transport system permease subunit
MQEIHSSIDVFDQVRLGAWAASIACALAVALTLLSIGGLVAENIRARTREFGIRLAVGASPARLRRATARDISGLAVIATLVAGAAGLVFRYPLSRAFYGATEQFKDGMLFGTTPHLAPTLLAAAAALCTLVIACAWVSTRTLQHLDPAALLREQ